MKKVARSELLDWMTYTDRRDAIRSEAMRAKDERRVHVGAYLTFLFENHVTIRYQVQEMMRIERLVREADVVHELETYNRLIGDEGELGCTLLVEIEDAIERDAKLQQWLALPDHVYVAFEDGTRAYAAVDDDQRTLGRLSTVQYLKFVTRGRVPVAVGCDHEAIRAEARLDPRQHAALAADLSG